MNKETRLILKAQSAILMGLIEPQKDMEIAKILVEVQEEIVDLLNPKKEDKAYEGSL